MPGHPESYVNINSMTELSFHRGDSEDGLFCPHEFCYGTFMLSSRVESVTKSFFGINRTSNVTKAHCHKMLTDYICYNNKLSV